MRGNRFWPSTRKKSDTADVLTASRVGGFHFGLVGGFESNLAETPATKSGCEIMRVARANSRWKVSLMFQRLPMRSCVNVTFRLVGLRSESS